MSDTVVRTLCKATTSRGFPCKQFAMSGSEYCYAHQAAPKGQQKQDLPEDEREQVAQELDRLIERVHTSSPDYQPPPFSPQNLLMMLGSNIERITPEIGMVILEKLRRAIHSDYLDIDTWKGLWYMLNYTFEYQADILKRRVTGDYIVDEWGFDQEYFDAVRPFFEFMYKIYWRVSTSGIENIPETGRALLVVNHSGQLPWDGAMVASAVTLEHPAARLVRTLYATWFPNLPLLSDLFVKCGQVLATDDNGDRLLNQDQLVAVFPEGIEGMGKLFKERYRLARFGRGGYIKMALKTRAPIIPVSVVGAEETYISLLKIPAIARLFHSPFFPITPTFPWLGPLGFVPLPTKWYIDFGTPIPADQYDSDAFNNLVLVSQLSDQVRTLIQEMINTRLSQRRSVFSG